MMNDECEISLNQSESVINVFLWCEVNAPLSKNGYEMKVIRYFGKYFGVLGSDL